MNPPHISHVLLGLHAAKELRNAGHTVSAIVFAPVHDNYLLNKISLKQKTDKSGENTGTDAGQLCFPMQG